MNPALKMAVLLVAAYPGLPVLAQNTVLTPASPENAAPIQLSDGTLTLESDSDSAFAAAGIMAAKGNGIVTIDVDPATRGTGRDLRLGGPLTLGFYTTLNLTSSNGYSLQAPEVSTAAPSPVLSPSTAKLEVGTLHGNVKLGGSSLESTLENFDGTMLEKQDTGTWTLTGDNSARSWNTAVNQGTLVLAKGAALGSGNISVSGTLAPRAGTSVTGTIGMANGGTIDLADGEIGTFTIHGMLRGPGGGTENLRFDLSDQGVDQLILDNPGETNDIRGTVVFVPLTKKLTPGTYTFIVLKNPSSTLMEHHFAFGFTGDPADHSHMIMSEQLNGYTLTIAPVVSPGGNWTAETLTIRPGR